MKRFNNSTVFKAVLLASGASTLAMAAPAMAQDANVGDDVQVGEEENAAERRIVVTGSRIGSQDFNSNSPMVTVDEGLLEQSSTAAIESNLNKLPQFVPAQTPTAGGDIQPTATNTPGAATISLRGIGTNRNLVLIDGRRGTPGNASGVVDISTIPAAAIERIETISGGASATYGADAVAGVTNFILKSNFEGLELDGQVGITQEGDNFEYQLSGIMGSDFADGRGNVSLALSMNTREANFQRDRDWYRDLYADPNIAGGQFFIPAPGINFGFGPNQPDYSTVFPGGPNGLPGVNVYVNPTTGNAFTIGANGTPSNFGNDAFDFPLDGLPFKQTINGAISSNNTSLYLILPLTRYNAFARGNYEINDWVGVFGQALFSHVETFTRNEPSPAVGGWTVNIDPTVLDPGELPDDLQTLLDSRPDPDAPFQLQSLLFDDRETFSDVTTYNLTAGLEGFIPSTSLAWEAFVSHGISSTYAKQTGVNSLSRFTEVITAPNFGRGFQRTGNQGPPNFGFGASTATCTSGLNLFNPPAGGFSEDCLEAIRADLKNRSEVTQTIAEANVSGGLFDIWAGEVGAAIGASYREIQFEFDNDTLTTDGRSFLDQAQGIYPSGNVDASYDVHELYAEMLIPLLSDLPFVQQFNLEIGGRISDYSTTGTSYTYKILGDLEITDWLRFRGGYNRAERAPNIGELFLQAQQTFGGNSVGDPCSLANPLDFSANQPGDQFAGGNANGARVEAICRIQMEASGNPDADEEYYAGVQSPDTGGFAFPTTVGNPNLVPEKADTWTAGVVLQPYFSGAISRARLTVDYYNIKVEDAIGLQTVGIALRSCYDPLLNPAFSGSNEDVANSQFCQLVPRNATGALGNVRRTYVNNGAFQLSGIDVALDLAAEVGPGTVNLNVLGNYALEFKSTSLAGILDQVDYVGTLGTGENGLNGGNYEYRLFTTLGYNWGPAYLGIQWQHLPSIEDATEALIGEPTPTTGFPSYNLFNLNGSFAVSEAVNLRFGIDNLFNEAPPLGGVNTAADPALGQLSGGGYNSLYYDTNGRRFYFGANLRF
ncbi:TonB-dependent receptor domain-containing protein [Aurantiacibacter poecillastricola]|uniref:TonB-dependent receptor domain-containing protein n=1 Tax=Aurantiacibacter poecillastricola TaxID=3064385 RepID=UPI00273D4C96|nr:TonB-dependent receptor [Aurantiacibacter sp. 219JJ12-13]MDP5262085.1 TonB-dependent receptor [Aurantiacibacter sp. 219JJ12-13]